MASSATTSTIAVRLGRGILLVLTAGALALAATGCSGDGDGNRDGNRDGDGGSDESSAAGATSAAPTGVGGLGEAENPTPSAGSQQGGGGEQGGGSQPGTGPRIVYFRVKQQPSCPQGTNLHTVPGRPLVIEWKVTGAQRADLAVDGPGRYNTYGARGTENLPFGCGGAPGTVERHTYMLTTVGGGPARSKTISASAKVNEITIVAGPAAESG